MNEDEVSSDAQIFRNMDDETQEMFSSYITTGSLEYYQGAYDVLKITFNFNFSKQIGVQNALLYAINKENRHHAAYMYMGVMVAIAARIEYIKSMAVK